MTSPADHPDRVDAEIEPDDKDWTWVLQRACPDCGFDAASVTGPQVAGRLRDHATRWSAVLQRADVSQRPEPHVWSPLEYACHVRDVCRLFESRLNLLRSQTDPLFENWDQDATAVAEDYGHQDPLVVSAQLSETAESAAAAFDSVGLDADVDAGVGVGGGVGSGPGGGVGAGDGADRDPWQRSGRRSDGSVFTIESLGQYFVHDVTHHLHDVRG